MPRVARKAIRGRSNDERGFSIRVASRLTGITADTLRIWERRYGFPAPVRTTSGHRVYTEQDVERLSLITRAMQAGYRASDAIAEPPERLRAFVAGQAGAGQDRSLGGDPIDPNGLLELLRDDEAEALRDALRRAAAMLGPRRFVADIAAPLTRLVGDAWHDGRIAVRHEHLASTTLSTQLRLLLTAYEPSRTAAVFLFTTLPGEQHGLGMEMAAVYAAARGAVVRLLGVDTPRVDIIDAASALGADVVGISVSSAAQPRHVAHEVRYVLERLPEHVELWLGGDAATKLALQHPRLSILTTWPEIDAALTKRLGRGHARRRHRHA